jgi:2-dehydropantoate 2-reductase
LWLKAIINSAINPLTAIHRVPNGRLLEDPELLRQSQDAAREAQAVAKALGIRLPVPDAWAAVAAVAKATAQNRSSMLQSLERGQRTEVDAITGAILQAARSTRVPCPTHERLYQEIKRLESRASN